MFRHAAAVALVRWYLMSAGSGPESPMSSWTIVGSFDTATDCRTALYGDLQKAVGDLKVRHRDKIPVAQLNSHDDGRDLDLLNEACIATDDPRLKAD